MAKAASGGSGSLKVSASSGKASTQSTSNKSQGTTKQTSVYGPQKPTATTSTAKTTSKVSGINANIPFVQLGTDPTKVYQTGDQQRDTAAIYRELYKGNYKAGDFESNRSATYLNSILDGQTRLDASNSDQFHSFLKEAQDFEALHRKEGDTARADYWLAMANTYQDVYKYSGLHYSDNRAQYAALEEEKSDLTTKQTELGSARNNANKSATVGMQSGNFLGEYAQILNDVKNNDARLAEISAEQAALDDDLFDTFATDEEKAVRDRLQNYTYAPTGSWRASANPNILTEEDKAKDQAIYDNFMSGMGLDTRYLNRVDKVNAWVNSTAASIGEGVVGAASIAAKAAFEAGEAEERFNYDAEHGPGAYDALHAGEKEARDQRQLDALKMERGTFSDTNEEIAVRTRVAQGQQAVDAAQAEFDKANEERDKYYESGGALVEDGKMSEYLSGKKAVDDRYREAKQALEKAKGELAQMSGEETSLRYDMAFNGGEQTMAKVDAVVDSLNATAQEETRKALVEASKLEKFVYEGGQTMVQMGFDMATAPMLGGSSLVPMFIRVLGQESAAARRQGATTEQQLRYGLTKAGIELLTEKMFGAFDKIGYGKGFANEMSERLVAMLADGDLGRTVVRTFLAMNEEGLEELISELLGPVAEEILRKGGGKEAWDKLWTPDGVAEMLHSYLLGAALGGLGAVGGIVTGENAEANQQLRRNAASSEIQALNNYNQEYDARMQEYTRWEGMSERDAEARVKQELGEAPTASAGSIAAQKIATIDQFFGALEQLTPENVAEFRDSLPDEVRLTQEEFDAAVKMGLLDKEDAPNYLVRGETAEGEETAPEATGEGVQSRLKKGDVKTEKTDVAGNPVHRMRQLTDRIAKAMGKLGYGFKGNSDQAFQDATGINPDELEANNNAESKSAMQEAGATPTPTGGDAASYNLSNYDQVGLNKLWKDRKLTSGNYAEAMVQRGFWSEQTARSFLSLVRREGDRLGINTTQERKRTLGNYMIGNTNENSTNNGKSSTINTNNDGEVDLNANNRRNDNQVVGSVQEANAGTTETADADGEISRGIGAHISGTGAQKSFQESLKEYEDAGGKAVPRDEWTPLEIEADEFLRGLGITGLTVIDPQGKQMPKNGSSSRTHPGTGVFAVRVNTGDSKADATTFRRTVLHEAIHNKITQARLSGNPAISLKINDEIKASGFISDDAYNHALAAIKDAYAHYLLGAPESFYDLLPEDKAIWYGKQSEDDLKRLESRARDELISFLFADQHQEIFETSQLYDLVRACRSIVSKYVLDNADIQVFQDYIEGKQANQKEDAEIEIPSNPPKPAVGSGIMGKQSQSAALQQQATRGEENTVREQGTIYVSKTNEERSRIADHVLSTEQSRDAEINRLINKDERWDDQDVVTAERAMYNMVRAIRDYQLGNKYKMPRSGFLALTNRYNELVRRHVREKSKAGQELQATYQFTESERIMNRMAKTFLGFTKDGEFAGEAPLAVNAKIYAGAEDAANRIGKAVEAKDAKALAQICKDISDIRGVKKMFGPASEFASKVENEILNAIAGQENGVEALQTLALGNLNAICDDVQPYQVLNAAKTIRVMNMLSNMSTIINNITNNIASGMTSTNAIAQGSSMLASKAFENVIGQPVLTKAQKGWIANKEIRNAELEALKMATLVQLYGVNQESGKLELNGDKGLFNPQANGFEQTMALYKFFVGMGVEATDQIKSAGLQKAMAKGIDEALAKGKITETQAEEMRREAKHEVERLLYKDDNALSNWVQGTRNFLNKKVHWGNDDIGTIGLGDIAMAFAKVPANVVRARLLATPEGCLYQLIQYGHGVAKAKRMHSEVLARQIAEKYAAEMNNINAELNKAYEIDPRENGQSFKEKKARIEELKQKKSALNKKMWSEAREQCSGSVYKKLTKLRDNYSADLLFGDAVGRAGYSDAKEMSQFEAASYSRRIGKAATSAGMMALGAVLRGLGALRDFDQEPDEELRKMYAQKGYTGLMLNLSAIGRPDHEWRDGDHVIGADFLEVVAMPLAIGACAAESAMIAEKGEGKKAKAFVKEFGWTGLGKAFEAVGDIPGMADAVNFYNAITSQFTSNETKGNKAFNAIVQYAANSLPSFVIPNAWTQLGAGIDNTVRDVYNTDNVWQQAKNIVLNKTMFFRDKIPASIDMWGEERTYGDNVLKGIINKSILPGDIRVYHQNKYEAEIIRLTKEGYKGATPKLSVSSSFEVGDETYTMDADEKREFRENRNSEQAEFYKAFMDSEYYNKLTDDQKVAVLRELKTECERDAKQTMLSNRGLDVEVTRAKWETELNLDQQIQYLSTKQEAMMYWDKSENSVSDFAGMDAFIAGDYKKLSEEQQKIINGSFSHLDDLADAAANGIKSEKWQAAYNIYQTYTEEDENGKRIFKSDLKNESEMWSKIQKATGFSDSGKEMKWLQEHMELTFTGSPNTSTYDELIYDYGLSRESASKIYGNFSTIKPTKGYADVQDRQKWVGLTQCGLSDREQWDSWFAMVPSNNTKQIANMTKLRGQVNPQTGKVYTFAEAIHKLKLDVIYWKEVLPNGKEKKHEIK